MASILSSNGLKIKETPICVDIFDFYPNETLYFLSHYHSDHISGLSSSWNFGYIYCSKLTHDILLFSKKFQNPQLIVPLELNYVHKIIICDVEISITLLDANHCPGSVMFFFQGYFGNILYTGDFRFKETMLQEDCLRNNIIDCLYIDNTFCTPTFQFPSRDEATQQIIQIIQNHSNYHVLLEKHYLGNEELLISLSKQFKTKIVIEDPLIFDLITTIIVPFESNHFSYDVTEAFTQFLGNIRVIPRNRISKQQITQFNQKGIPTIKIIPTGLYQKPEKESSEKNYIFFVNFCNHSNFQELTRFVQFLKPREIQPIVMKNGQELNDFFSCHLNKIPRSKIVIPHSIFPTISSYSIFTLSTYKPIGSTILQLLNENDNHNYLNNMESLPNKNKHDSFKTKNETNFCKLTPQMQDSSVLLSQYINDSSESTETQSFDDNNEINNLIIPTTTSVLTDTYCNALGGNCFSIRQYIQKKSKKQKN